VELFFAEVKFWKKIPLYLVGSAIMSTFLVAALGLIFGLSRGLLLGVAAVFLIAALYVFFKKKKYNSDEIKKRLPEIIVGVFIYAIYFTALYPAIFSFYNNYFVMGGPNWQDTAMHLSIIESIAQGNFPPQAPYFSGQPLNYYYFADLHAAIANIFFGDFFPEILTLLNPFWAATFYFSVFALTYRLTKKKIFSVIAGFSAVFYGNLGFVNFFNALIKQNKNYFELVAVNPFNFNFDYLQMVPMSDYFLQNRPMMAGLSLVTVAILLLIDSSKNRKNIIFAGIIAGSLLKFQMFGFLVVWMFFGIYFFVNLITKKITFKKVIKAAILFAPTTLILGLISVASKVGTRSMFQVFLDSFSFGPWQAHDAGWFIWFFIGNLGIGFVVYIFSLFLKPLRKDTAALCLAILSLVLLAIPVSMKFTLYEFDMLKFYYYLIPLISVLLGFYFANSKHKSAAVFLFIFLTITSSLTSINLLAHSYLNKTLGYSYSDYESGIWIRENIPQKSVFVTLPTVHSAPSDIGGRLRVISYINWPYSHGFNTGSDNVFSRVYDVRVVYETGDTSQIKLKYGAKFIYLGHEEKAQFPNADRVFDKETNLNKVYDKDGIKIYEIF